MQNSGLRQRCKILLSLERVGKDRGYSQGRVGWCGLVLILDFEVWVLFGMGLGYNE